MSSLFQVVRTLSGLDAKAPACDGGRVPGAVTASSISDKGLFSL
jgi:hypothetical protein